MAEEAVSPDEGRAGDADILVASPRCALCGDVFTVGEVVRVVVVVTRTAPLFRRGETWCEGCGTLVYGLHLFRHAKLRKEDR